MGKQEPSKYLDPQYLDPAERAVKGLEMMVTKEALTDEGNPSPEALTDTTTERLAPSVVETVSERNLLRLLVVTRDARVFEEGSLAVEHIGELSTLFSEVHVIVLNSGATKLPEAVRFGGSVFVYATNADSWWKTMFAARRVAKTQLEFSNGFRPDLILAEDPFESGIVAHWLARHYDRPFQVHIKENFFDPLFRTYTKENKWRIHIAKYLLKRVTCVRTHSAYLKGLIEEKYKKLRGNVLTLPVFYNLEAWKEAKPTVGLLSKYPRFKLVLLHVSAMNDVSHTKAIIDGVFYLLRQYPTIGMVILGNGPARWQLENIVSGYGLKDQIVFESDTSDVLSWMKVAHMFIHDPEDASLDELVLKSAAVGLPIVSGNRGLPSELFVDGESVLLCPVDSPPCFGEKVNRLLNENELRKRLAIHAREVVFESVEQDYGAYLEAYRASIELCLVQEEGAKKV